MKTKILNISDLSEFQRNRMFQIMSFYYDNVTRTQFDIDLDEKSKVILLLAESGQLHGFSTVLRQEMFVHGKKVIALYSGDTVLDREHWGNGALGIAFSKLLLQVKIKNPLTPVYWFLISKGYKTYLLMANNFPNHYPRYERNTPVWQKALMASFYRTRFGAQYDEQKDLIRPLENSCALKVSVADIDSKLLEHPRIAFFAHSNSQWQKGQELACIAEVDFWIPIRYKLKRIKKKIFAVLSPKEIYALHKNT